MSQRVFPSVSQEEKALLADPAPLGLAAFAFTTFLLSFYNAGWLGAGTVDTVVPLAMFYGGSMQILAGAFEMRRGNTFGFTAFCSYGAFWWFYAILALLGPVMGILQPSAAAIGAALVLWGIFTLYMWIPAMFANLGLNFTFLFLWLAFVTLGAGQLYASSLATQIGGYFGVLAAFFAAYTSFAIVTNSVVGAGTLPLGPSVRRRA